MLIDDGTDSADTVLGKIRNYILPIVELVSMARKQGDYMATTAIRKLNNFI